MTELLTAAQMRAVERAEIDRGAATGLALMERAGRAVVAAIFAQWPDLAPTWGPAPKPPEFSGQDEGESHHAVVLCGPGNNGGDGFVIARLLRDAGWHVAVFLYGDAAKLPRDARVNALRWGETCVLDDRCLAQITDASLVVDALFGTGLARPLRGLGAVLQGLCDRVDAGAGPVVAVDLPSGLCADSGRVLRGGDGAPCGKADLTVAFHAAKSGHYLGDGPRHCGRVVVADIGLTDPAPRSVGLITAPSVALGKGAGHKFSHGHALVLSGGVGKGGAARLAARGALRVGAGVVTLGCPPAALIENAAQLNAVMLQAIKDADALAQVLMDPRITAVCLGPGLGLGARAAALVAATLGREGARPAVLDADALTLLAGDPALFGALHARCVLTPHAGEFARLFPDLAEKLAAPSVTGPAYSKVDATRDAARRVGCVVLFKGPDTVIADPSGRCSINASVYARAAPWLATAGSGDVLAGVIVGLLARGHAPMQAAETAAWLHTETALHCGPGLIAEDLPEALPQVFRALGL
ncbi:NAD(P)H-hydrate dehydratase [Yoonia sp.]|uniref:NAD(P)H-hydrate dehydratase n=1 Tax=Yoonia sp. TaxID=2212373 RepID=UPI0019FDF562|nr:NAD(P)H-hydrate dehydratase [Yoonia sp.]MBE0414136.1 NAD(P)H-hydrate dehydratase [Yoonia sp.]